MAAGGLEVLGAVVAIIEVIDLGMAVARKLCAFCRDAKAANESMKGLSIDVTLTCAILSDLAKVMKKDKVVKFTPKSAFEIAEKVIQESKVVFENIRLVIERQEREAKQNLLQRMAYRITIASRSHELETLKVNLERLKSTVGLMLNVMILAGQVRQ
ncbi:hypothetical protein N7493_007455 [Penicillium malachiteum]|uniref:NACHT-NTPase and P-loop NTPases N-terminal domain-containing protein n=1 Tax=Penicillium malachiteum TaxID=1324776 RepID=A0AAD6HHS4_9EURO|nr:hypothetical protein N7493_007455 [Penicillium malachiteum]